MGFLYAFLVLVASVFIAAATLLALASIYFDASHSEIPPGVERPVKLRIRHAWIVGAAVLGRILENLHICTQIQFVRYLGSRRKLGEDSTLFLKDTKFEHVPVRIYQPKALSVGQRKGIIYFHGGGWVIGSIGTHDDICRYLAKESDSVVVSVEYRLAPEHSFPTPLNDCLTAASHFLEAAEGYGVNKTRVIVAGDSAGGNLAAAVCQALASKPGLVQFGRDPGGTGKSTYGRDFVHYPVEVPDRVVLRRIKKQVNGLPKKYILTHHEEPKHQHLITQYDDQYNRRGYNCPLPPLRMWNRHKLAWTPEKSDCPLKEPPTNYGLFEHLVKKWTFKEPGLMNSLYKASYTKPPISAYAVRRRPITTHIQKASHEQWLPRNP